MSRRGSENRLMGDEVLVRLPAELGAALTRAAAADNVKRAPFVRAILSERLGLEVDAQRPNQIPSRHRSEILPEVAALASLGTNVARLTGALIQSAKATRETGTAVGLHAEIEATLSDLKALHAQIRLVLQGWLS